MAAQTPLPPPPPLACPSLRPSCSAQRRQCPARHWSIRPVLSSLLFLPLALLLSILLLLALPIKPCVWLTATRKVSTLSLRYISLSLSGESLVNGVTNGTPPTYRATMSILHLKDLQCHKSRHQSSICGDDATKCPFVVHVHVKHSSLSPPSRHGPTILWDCLWLEERKTVSDNNRPRKQRWMDRPRSTPRCIVRGGRGPRCSCVDNRAERQLCNKQRTSRVSINEGTCKNRKRGVKQRT